MRYNTAVNPTEQTFTEDALEYLSRNRHCIAYSGPGATAMELALRDIYLRNRLPPITNATPEMEAEAMAAIRNTVTPRERELADKGAIRMACYGNQVGLSHGERTALLKCLRVDESRARQRASKRRRRAPVWQQQAAQPFALGAL